MDLNQQEISIFRPKLPVADLVFPYLQSIDESNIYSNRGPLVRGLEARYAQMFNVEISRVVILANATLALQGLTTILDVSTMKAPDFTFAATGHAVLNSGKNLELVDIDSSTWQMSIPELNSGQSTGYMPVMPFGAAIPLREWNEIPNVIFDAAASLGSTLPELGLLNDSSAVVFSLHATKVGGCGEGSVIVCGSDAMAEKLQRWGNFGFSEDRTAGTLGTNAKMSEYQAAVGHAVLDFWQDELNEWRFSNKLANELSIRFEFDSITSYYKGVSPYWITQFKDKKIRDHVAFHLASKGVSTRNWWATPLSEMPAFAQYSKGMRNENSMHACETSLGLPMYRGLSADITEFIVREILEVLTIYK